MCREIEICKENDITTLEVSKFDIMRKIIQRNKIHK